MIFVPGVIFAPTYYFAFKWFIKKNNVVIAEGAEAGELDMFGDAEEDEGDGATENVVTKRAEAIITGLGGIDNIDYVTNCITRLRVDVKDTILANENMLKQTGSIGIKKVSKTHIQVVYGAIVEQVAEEVKDALEILKG
jgi:PTS system maltose and glucose-specific IIC component